MNLDPRSVHLNTEMGIIIEQPEYAQKVYRELMHEITTMAYKVAVKDGDIVWIDNAADEILTSEPGASLWRRFGAWFSGILPIEEQL